MGEWTWRAFKIVQSIVERLPRSWAYALAVLGARIAWWFSPLARPRLEYNLLSNLPGGYPDAGVRLAPTSWSDWGVISGWDRLLLSPGFEFIGWPVMALAVAAPLFARRRLSVPYFAVFGLAVLIGVAAIYLALPAISGAFLPEPISIFPLPFKDLTPNTESFLPSVPIMLSLDLGLVIAGMVLPFWAMVGSFVGLIVCITANPMLSKPFAAMSCCSAEIDSRTILRSAAMHSLPHGPMASNASISSAIQRAWVAPFHSPTLTETIPTRNQNAISRTSTAI